MTRKRSGTKTMTTNENTTSETSVVSETKPTTLTTDVKTDIVAENTLETNVDTVETKTPEGENTSSEEDSTLNTVLSDEVIAESTELPQLGNEETSKEPTPEIAALTEKLVETKSDIEAQVKAPEVSAALLEQFTAKKPMAIINLESVVMDYLNTMAPGKPLANHVLAAKQTSLFRAIVAMIRQSDPDVFGQGMQYIFTTFAANATKHFALTHILRGMNNVQLSKNEISLMELMFPAIRTYALGRGDQLSYSRVSFDTVFGSYFNELEKQRLNYFIRIWCGVS
jgi:hypothetical protein